MITATLFTSEDAYPDYMRAVDSPHTVRFQVDLHESGGISVDQTIILQVTQRDGFEILVGEGEGGPLERIYINQEVPA